MALNFKDVYAGLRDKHGRHFSRGEFFYRIQDPEYLESILLGEEASGALDWVHHPAAERAEEEADRRWSEKQREQREAEKRQWEAELEAQRLEEERQKKQAELDALERENKYFESQGVETLPIVRKGVHFFADGCPLHGQANIATDCGDFALNPNKCIFFEGKGYYLIGCTAHQNGVGLEKD